MKKISILNRAKVRFIRGALFLPWLVFVSTFAGAQTQLVSWDVSGVTNYGVSPFAPTAVNANLENIVGFTRGTGLSAGTGGVTGGWGATNWSDTEANAITADDVIYFGFEPKAGFAVSLTSINPFSYRRSGTGPNTGKLQFSTDGGSNYFFTSTGSISFGSDAPSGAGVPSGINTSVDAGLQQVNSSVGLKLIPFGATSALGTFYIFDVNSSGDDFSINGRILGSETLALSGLDTFFGFESASQSFELKGDGLTSSDITLTAPAGFEISSDNVSFGNTLSLTPTAGSVTATVHVRIASTTAVGAQSGNLTIIGGGFTSGANLKVVLSGDVNPLPIVNISQNTSFLTIQEAIDDASTVDGDIITVAAGTYAENITINKELTINGPNVGVSPNSGTRVEEAILVPASSAADGDIISIEASNVKIDGLTINGDNESLTSGWIGTNGADIDAGSAVAVYAPNVNNLVVSNNIIENVGYFGVFMFGSATSEANTSKTGNEISDNLIRDLGHYNTGNGYDNWGGGMYLGNSHYTNVKNNIMTNVRIGIQTGNFQTTHVGDAQYQVIDGNTIQTRYLGIFFNLHRYSPWTISNNTITGIDNATQAGLTTRPWRGILLGSLGNNMGSSTLSNNTIDGSAITLFTTGKEGVNVWNVKDDSFATITGGSISGVDTGIFLNNYEGFATNAADGAHATISGVTITATGTGIRLLDSPSSTSNAAVEATLGSGVIVNGGTDGLSIENTAAKVISPTGDIAFNTQSGDYIKLIANANDVNMAAASFDGQTGATASLTENFAIENKITHKVDDSALGLIRVKDAELFVTTNSGSIQRAVDAATAADIVNVNSGTYDEQVTVNKELTINGVGATKPVISFTGTATGKKALFDVSADKVTINNFEMDVDLTKLSSGIVATSAGLDEITITNNVINAKGSSGAASFGSYGLRNAISINYAAYRAATGGVDKITLTNNTVTAVADDGFGVARTFRSAVSVDEGGGTYTGNDFTSINHDILIRFNNNGAILIDDNDFRGGGVQLAAHNAGGGQVDITNNMFDSPFANTYTSSLRLQYNNPGKQTNVSGNTFNNHNWGISLENYKSVVIDNNEFTPLANSTSYRHITTNTKVIATDPTPISQTAIDATFTNNTFNGSGTIGGSALVFYNHDDANDSYGTFTIGTSGNENTFNDGITDFIRLGDETGATSALAATYGYTGIPSTTAACWPTDLDAKFNKFDVGSGAKLAADLTSIERAALEGKIFHKPDNACLAEVEYFLPIKNITQSTTYANFTDAISAANSGDVLEAAAGSYTEDFTVNKALTINGANVGIAGTATRTDESVLLNSKVTISGSDPVVFDGFKFLREDAVAGDVVLVGNTPTTITNNIFERNGSATGTGIRAVVTAAGAATKTISNNLFTGDISGGLFSGHKTWNNGIYVNGATGTVNIQNNTFENTRTALNIDDHQVGIVVEANTFTNNGTHIAFGGTSPTTGSFTLGTNNFELSGSAIMNLNNVADEFRLNITSSSYKGTALASATDADLFEFEAQLFHKGRSGRKGKVVYKANNQYVNNFATPFTKIDVIQNSVLYADANDAINLQAGTYNQRVVIDKSNVTLQGADTDETLYIIDGTGLSGNGDGVQLTNGSANVTIKQLTIQNFSGGGGNTDAGIYAVGGNDGLQVDDVVVKNNVGGSGIYANGPIDGVSITNSTIEGQTSGARGIVIWNGFKQNITITGNTLSNNNCCGIELQDGTASAVNISNNTIDIGSGDNAIGLTSLNELTGPNLIDNNTITGGGRYGIEVKNPAGGVTVSNNSVSLTTQNADLRDRAGIAVFRRGFIVGQGYVNIPNGVTVTGNTVTGYQQTSDSEGFGIVVEGTNHTVSNNTLENNDIGVQQQAGHTPYTADAAGDGDQSNLTDLYFGRGNSPELCNVSLTGNTYTSNGVDERIVIGGGTGTVVAEVTPTVDDPADIEACNGETIAATTFTGNNLPGVVYNWANDNTAIGLAASGTGDITSFVVANAASTPITATITVTPNLNGCDGTPQEFTITVNPSPIVASISDQTICVGESVSAISFAGNGTTYNWVNNNDAIGLALTGTGDIASFTAINTTGVPQIAYVTVTPTFASSNSTCVGESQSFSITVKDDAAAELICQDDATIDNDAGLCSAVYNFDLPLAFDPQFFDGFENLNWSNSSLGWTNFNSVIRGVENPLDVTNRIGDINTIGDSQTGVFSRLGGYSNTFGNGFRTKVDVYINLADPAVTANTYGFDVSTAANGQDGNHQRDFVFHAASNASGNVLIGGSNNSNFAKRNDLASGNHYEITSSGWYTFEWMFQDKGDGTLEVDLNLKDDTGSTLFTETRNNPADVVATEVGGNRYMWFTFIATNSLMIDNVEKANILPTTSDIASGSAFPVGTTTVTITAAADACGNQATCTFDVTVNDVEAPVFTNCPTDAIVCSDDATYSWTHVTLSDICDLTGGLQELAYTLSGATTSASPVAVTSFDGSTQGTETFNTGVTTVTYSGKDAAGNVVSNVCSFTVTVNDGAVVEAGTYVAICKGESVELAGSFSGTASSVTWSDGTTGGSFAPNANDPLATYTPPASFTGTVTLTITSDDPVGPCQAATATATLVVNPPPTVAITPVTPFCEGGTLTLAASVTGATTYAWSGPDGFTSSDPNPTILNATAAASGNYTLIVTSANLCTATAMVSVTIYPLPSAPTITSDNNEVCKGTNAVLSASCAVATDIFRWTTPPITQGTSNLSSTGTQIVTAPGTYTGYCESVNGCIGENGSITITEGINCDGGNFIVITPELPVVCPSASIQLTASGCATGTVSWTATSGTVTGAIVTLSPAATTTYLVTCSTGGSTSIDVRVAEPNVVVTNNISTGKSVVKAVNTIVSNKSVGNPNVTPAPNVIYEAGNSITLAPGFVAQGTAVFKAEIKGCN